jgi:hypothetical protein
MAAHFASHRWSPAESAECCSCTCGGRAREAAVCCGCRTLLSHAAAAGRRRPHGGGRATAVRSSSRVEEAVWQPCTQLCGSAERLSSVRVPKRLSSVRVPAAALEREGGELVAEVVEAAADGGLQVHHLGECGGEGAQMVLQSVNLARHTIPPAPRTPARAPRSPGSASACACTVSAHAEPASARTSESARTHQRNLEWHSAGPLSLEDHRCVCTGCDAGWHLDSSCMECMHACAVRTSQTSSAVSHASALWHSARCSSSGTIVDVVVRIFWNTPSSRRRSVASVLQRHSATIAGPPRGAAPPIDCHCPAASCVRRIATVSMWKLHAMAG